MSTLTVDLDLVKKYNVAGPRYTSYPPATQFTDKVRWAEVQERIAQSQDAARGISLYFHLPFCESLCWYCGCTTVITTQHSQSAVYLQYLEKEMDAMKRLVNPDRKAVQLHFGGGTPTFLSPREIRKLGGLIRQRFQYASDIEAGVEVDPRRLTREHVKALCDAGFNRASVGVQDYDPVVQHAVHRIQPREQTEQVIAWLREEGFASVNVDLIYGLPHQTIESFNNTIRAILEIKPDRLAVFNYAHVPWIKPAQKILEDGLPTPELKLQLLKLVIETLTNEAGYVYIGMDHFAKPTDELAVAQANKTLQRNFQGYSTRGGTDIYAFGMSSISQAESVYWQNEKELKPYYAALDAGQAPLAKAYLMTDDDKVRRTTIMRLMCDLGLDYAAMSKLLNVDFQSYFASELGSLVDLEIDGLLEREDGGMRVTDMGRMFIRNIAMKFDAYLPTEKERRFSKTV